SFADDQLRFHRPWFDLWGRWLDLWSFRRNVDELLIDEFAQYGPVIALGRPGESRVPFGAARRYATHEEWQDAITDAAKRAQVIVLAAGETRGLTWEYELIKREGLLEKPIALFPPATARGVDTRAIDLFTEHFDEAKIAFDPAHEAPIAFAMTGGEPALVT